MAIRVSLGKFRPRFSLPKWGVRGSLLAAFAVIAGMGLVISAGAGFVFNHLGTTMMDLSARDIPRLSASLQLASQSATLAAQGPGLLASPTEDALNERTKKVQEMQQLAIGKLGDQKPQFNLEIHLPNGDKLYKVLGPHAPNLTANEVNLLHRLWLRFSDAVAPLEIHHHDVVHFALEEVQKEIDEGHEDIVVNRLRAHLEANQKKKTPKT